MEKRECEFRLDYPLDWAYEVSIEQLKKDIVALEKLGATHVHIEEGVDDGYSYLVIEAVSRRIETDEEFEQRKKRTS